MRTEIEILFLGSSPVATSRTWILHERGIPAIWHRNTAYFCPECGDIWARRVFTHAAPLTGWAVENRYCEKHGDGTLLTRPAHALDLLNPSFSFLCRELLLWSTRREYNPFDRSSEPLDTIR